MARHITSNDDPFALGFIAYEDGNGSSEDNPYQDSPDLYADWEDGFKEAQRLERVRLSRISRRFNPEDVAEAIGLPLKDWPGNCYAIACAMLDAGLVEGRPVHGDFLGKVHPECEKFAGRAVVRHGWIEAEIDHELVIIDPTRWYFQQAAPYIAVRRQGDREYDEGGSARAKQVNRMKEIPGILEVMGHDSTQYPMNAAVKNLAREVWGDDATQGKICTPALMYLANKTIPELGDRLVPLYQWLKLHNRCTLMPMDSQLKAQHEISQTPKAPRVAMGI